jgi:hypothetical protein
MLEMWARKKKKNKKEQKKKKKKKKSETKSDSTFSLPNIRHKVV